MIIDEPACAGRGSGLPREVSVMRLLRLVLAVLALTVSAAAGTATAQSVPTAAAVPERLRLDVSDWVDRTTTVRAHAPVPDTADGIGPGSALLITIPNEGTFICSANFVWAQGGKRYLGAAGHCFLPGTKTATHGPGKDYDANGVTTRVCVSECLTGGELTGLTGAFVALGRVAYARQTGLGGDVGNDFGLVEIPASRAALIRPAMPMWNGPSVSGTLAAGDLACHYGNGVAVGEVFPTKGRVGVGLRTNPTFWAADTAAAPGDSGSALATCVSDGAGLHGVKAIGILTHIAPGQGGIVGTTMSRAVAMAAEAKLQISPVLPKA